jgi:hypothetical protein
VFLVVLSGFVVLGTACSSRDASAKLPSQLTDEQFWTLTERLSEPAGVFRHSDNLVSNEALFAHTIQRLRSSGGVYIGVGPEQNYSYIARLLPAMAFIIDIRQENRNLHLMYKALFEVSLDRADFLSRLFSRERPAGLHRNDSVEDLFEAYADARPSDRLQDAGTRLLRERLLNAHGFALTPADLRSIDLAFHAFFTDGPQIHYGRALPPTAAGPSYQTLMTARDVRGVSRSYLASEESFSFVKDLHARNLIVPVVGDFGGPDAIRRVGEYIRQQQGVVSAFYSSNVEVYLSRDQKRAFCGSLAELPIDGRTWFIESRKLQPLRAKLNACVTIPPSLHWQ